MEGTSIFMTVLNFIKGGGVFMFVILGVWGVGIVIALDRFRKLSKNFDVDGPSFMNEIQRYVLSNDIQGAIFIAFKRTTVLQKV